MTDNRAWLRADTNRLHRRLTERGVVVLAVLEHDREWLAVYLHGLAGNDHQERAFDVLMLLPDIVEVRVSERSASILLVRQQAAAGD
jgi:hypothetical protein